MNRLTLNHLSVTNPTFLALLAVTLLTASCVTTHSGTPIEAGPSILISCSPNSELSEGTVQAYTVTIENTSEEWKNVKVSSVEFLGLDGSKDSTFVLSPQQLSAYHEAFQYKKAKDEYNASLALGSLFFTGAVIAGSSDSTSARTAGLGLAATSVVVDGGRDLNAAYSASAHAQAPQYGKGHLLNNDIQIPGKLFTRKALLADSTKWSEKIMRLCLSEPTQRCHEFLIKHSNNRNVCKSREEGALPACDERARVGTACKGA